MALSRIGARAPAFRSHLLAACAREHQQAIRIIWVCVSKGRYNLLTHPSRSFMITHIVASKTVGFQTKLVGDLSLGGDQARHAAFSKPCCLVAEDQTLIVLALEVRPRGCRHRDC